MHEKTISEIFVGSFSTINYIALDYLYQKDIETSKYILWKCEEIIQNDSLNHFFDSKILLYNNLGCCYKALDELFESLTYFEKALNIIEKGTGKKYIGYTYLNISIILFKQKRFYSKFFSSFLTSF